MFVFSSGIQADRFHTYFSDTIPVRHNDDHFSNGFRSIESKKKLRINVILIRLKNISHFVLGDRTASR